MRPAWRQRIAGLLVAVSVVAPLATPAHAYLKFGVEVAGRIVPVRWGAGPIRYFVTERDFSGISPQAFSDGCHQTNPVPVTENDLRDLYFKAL